MNKKTLETRAFLIVVENWTEGIADGANLYEGYFAEREGMDPSGKLTVLEIVELINKFKVK